MKRKINAILISTLLGATMLSSCAGANYKVTFSPNWLQNVYGDQSQVAETLVYDVSFKESTPLNNYKLTYESGTYTTTLTTRKVGTSIEYDYTTNLQISGTYSFETNAYSFNDSVTSSVTFQSTEKALTPIRMEKTYVSHTPMNADVGLTTQFSAWKKSGNLVIDYTTGDVVLKTTTYTTEPPKEQTQEMKVRYKNDKYSKLDNEQIWLGLRAVTQAENNAPTFMVYSAFNKNSQLVTGTFGKKVTEDDFTFTVNGSQVSGEISYFPVSVVLNEKNPGKTQTLWIASSTDPQNNTLRNAILRYEAPLPYNLGTLIYQLKSATFNS